jgi:diguanylate cyclase (GGDEF)-like protein
VHELGDTPTFDPAKAMEIVEAVLASVEGDDSWHDRLTENFLGALPDVRELSLLRDVLRGHLRSARPLDDAIDAVGRGEEAIDRLVTDRTSRDVAALQSVAFLDPLTGVSNRRALSRDLPRELSRAKRRGTKVSVAAIDLDGLKRINDEFGHGAGDIALQGLAHALVETLRLGDTVYRVGGDEFVVVLPETDGSVVAPLLGRCLTSAPRFSFGVATAPDDASTASQLLDVADSRLLSGRRNERSPRAPATGSPIDEVVIELDKHRAGERPAVFDEMTVVTRERTLDVEVVLRLEHTTVRGRADGSNVGTAAPQVAAGAVVDALTAIDPDLANAHIDGAEIMRVGTSSVAVVTVMLPTAAGEARYTGAAFVRDRGPLEASAKAMLHALNRRMGRLAEASA